jgi:hypothetical protein
VDGEEPITGIGWFPGDAGVLLLHDREADASADSWGGWADWFAQLGYAVLAVDLPENASAKHVQAAIAELRTRVGGKAFIVAAGETVALLDGSMADGFVLIAPRGEALDPLAMGAAPKLILAGTQDGSAFAIVERFARGCRGWSLLSAFVTENTMAALFDGRHALQVGSQIAGFLQEYRRPVTAQRPGAARPRRS